MEGPHAHVDSLLVSGFHFYAIVINGERSTKFVLIHLSETLAEYGKERRFGSFLI